MEKEKVNHLEIKKRIEHVLNYELTELELYILKAHLILEREMIQFLEYKCRGTVDFTFHMLQKILVEMYDGFNFPSWVPEKKVMTFVRLLTKVRNQIAHSFAWKPEDMQQLIDASNDIMNGTKEIDTPYVGMFNDTLSIISILLILKSGRNVYAKNERAFDDVNKKT